MQIKYAWAAIGLPVLVCSSLAQAAPCTNPLPITTQPGASPVISNFSAGTDANGNCVLNTSLNYVSNAPIVQDPCQANAHIYTPISVAASGPTQLTPGVSGKNLFVCNFWLSPQAVVNTFSLIYGTGTNCGTGTAALYGGVSPSLGTVNTSGFVVGTALAAVWATQVTGSAICINPSTSGQLSGSMVSVSQ